MECAVPVTARLSKLFYDRFGDEVVGELVDWLNSVDADYRSALRQQNEANFVRFDATLEQRLAEQGAGFERRLAAIEQRLAGFEQRLAGFEQRLGRIEERLDQFESRLSALERTVDRGAAEQREFIERSLKEQTRWMFVAWGSLMIPIIGLWFRG